jgi:hypothetical protein
MESFDTSVWTVNDNALFGCMVFFRWVELHFLRRHRWKLMMAIRSDGLCGIASDLIQLSRLSRIATRQGVNRLFFVRIERLIGRTRHLTRHLTQAVRQASLRLSPQSTLRYLACLQKHTALELSLDSWNWKQSVLGSQTWNDYQASFILALKLAIVNRSMGPGKVPTCQSCNVLEHLRILSQFA